MTRRHAAAACRRVIAFFADRRRAVRDLRSRRCATWGSSEAAPSFQALFRPTRTSATACKPNARTHFATAEFDADIAINAPACATTTTSAPSRPTSGASCCSATRWCCRCRCRSAADVRRAARAPPQRAPRRPIRYRVINAGVQGYGPVEELLFFRTIARPGPAGSGASPTSSSATTPRKPSRRAASSTQPRPPPTVADATRSSPACAGWCAAAWSCRSLRLRVVAATDRLRPQLAPPEPPLQSYAASPAPRIARGLAIDARPCVEDVAATAAEARRAGRWSC